MLACKLQQKVEELKKQGIYVNPGYGKPKRKIKKSMYKGIHWDKTTEQWQAKIWVDGEQVTVSSEGCSKDEEKLATKVRTQTLKYKREGANVSTDYGKIKKIQTIKIEKLISKKKNKQLNY
jgi:hypothetical protein